MKLETFFEKFDQFADAPDAVEKMRELVLDWASSGKLFHSDSAEWKEGVLGDVIELISGQHLLAHEHNAEGRGIPYLTGPSDFGEKSPSPTRWTDQPKVTAEPGDILITVKGSGVGKTNVLVDQPTAISRQLMAIRVTGADPEFVHIALKRAAEHFQNAKTGVAIPGIGRREVLGLKVVLPPLAEQKRIVAKVDELMALCDRLALQQQERETRHAALARASLARFADAPTTANLNLLFHSSFNIHPSDLRKSILTLAVQGLLVPHDAESADCETRKLKDLTTKIGSGSTPSGGKESYQETGVPLIRSMNVHFGGFVRDGLAFLNDEQAEKLKNVTVKADDVLLNITGASIGRVATAPKDMEGARVNQHVCIIRPTAEIIPPFLELFLASPVVQDLIDDVQVGATREALTKAMIEQFEIPIPPLAEQRRIVAKVEQLMALVDALEQQLAASRATAANLLTALVAELTRPQPRSAPTRPATEPRKYLVQFVTALLSHLRRPISLQELTRAVVFLFSPNRLLPLAESVGGEFAKRHFENFAQTNADGALSDALKVLRQSGAISYIQQEREPLLKFDPAKAPPITPLIGQDGKYMADILDLLPADDAIQGIETHAHQLEREISTVM